MSQGKTRPESRLLASKWSTELVTLNLMSIVIARPLEDSIQGGVRSTYILVPRYMTRTS